MVGGLVTHTFNQQRLFLKVVMFVIKDEHPFTVVEGVGYKDMMKEAEPRFKLPDRKKIAAGVWDLYLVEKAKMRSVIGGQRVSITTDTWTSIQNINYMVVTAHFLDSDWKLHRRIINFTKITSHKGDDIRRVLEGCLNDWGIDKVFTITVDNASSNDGAVDYMAKRLKERGTLLVDEKYLHLRCACHILNLVVKSELKYLASSIEGIRNCVKYIHSSGARLDNFREFAILLKMDKMANVPIDVPTRWNATYKMLDVAYKYKKVFGRMAEENVQFCEYFNEMERDASKRLVKRVGPPVEEDWERSLAFEHFLKLFYDSALKLSATKKVTSHIVWEEIVALQVEIEEKMVDISNPTLQKVAYTMKRKFEKYWGSWRNDDDGVEGVNDLVNKLVFLGQVLDPRFKLQMLHINFDALGAGQCKIARMIAELKNCLLELYNAYKVGNTTIGAHSNMDIGVVDDEDALEIAYADCPRKLVMIKTMLQQRKEQHKEISNDVDKYFAAPYQKWETKDFDLLQWWKGNTKEYPILSAIAKDIFAIPTSIIASENAFSLGRKIVDPFKASLTPQMVEALVCTSDWLRAEEFNFYKEPTEEQIEFYKEMEEMVAISNATQSSSAMQPPSLSTSQDSRIRS